MKKNNMDKSDTPATEPDANDLVDVALTPTTSLETEASSSRTEGESPKPKKDSVKRIFGGRGRKRCANVLDEQTSGPSNQNLVQTAGSVESLGAPSELNSSALPKFRKVSAEPSVATVESEGRRGLRNMVSMYWNSLFTKKPNKDSEESPEPQNSPSAETDDVVEKAEDKISPSKKRDN